MRFTAFVPAPALELSSLKAFAAVSAPEAAEVGFPTNKCPIDRVSNAID